MHGASRCAAVAELISAGASRRSRVVLRPYSSGSCAVSWSNETIPSARYQVHQIDLRRLASAALTKPAGAGPAGWFPWVIASVADRDLFLPRLTCRGGGWDCTQHVQGRLNEFMEN